MTTTEARHWKHRTNRPWRARLHKAAYLFAVTLSATIALHWTLTRVLSPLAHDVSFRFVDAFAAVMTLALITLTLSVAWRLGAGPRA